MRPRVNEQRRGQPQAEEHRPHGRAIRSSRADAPSIDAEARMLGFLAPLGQFTRSLKVTVGRCRRRQGPRSRPPCANPRMLHAVRPSPSTLPLASALVGLAAGLGLSIPLARGDTKPATIDVSEIREGMKGYGLSVFHGTRPERFDVEVLGTLHNYRPSQDLVLIRTPNNARLDVAKGVHGMSGSPIYLDGRLAGAYSYIPGGAFPSEPVVGFTPIAPMLSEMHRPVPPGFWPIEGGAPLPLQMRGSPLSPKSGATSFDGPAGSYDLAEHAAQIAKRLRSDGPGMFAPTTTPILVAGLSDRSVAYLGKLLDPLGYEMVQGGGGGGSQGKVEPGELDHFVDGGSLGVSLVAGDMGAFSLGTVTHVEGNRLCAFGHPMNQAGNIDLPTALMRILWINAGLQSSFKVGEPIRTMGALVQDRLSAVVAETDRKAPSFPVSIEIHGVQGAVKTSWNTTLAEERFMSAGLTAAVIGTAIDSTTSEHRDVTWKLVSQVSVKGHGTITLEDFGVAVGGTPDAGELRSLARRSDGGGRAEQPLGDVADREGRERPHREVLARRVAPPWHRRPGRHGRRRQGRAPRPPPRPLHGWRGDADDRREDAGGARGEGGRHRGRPWLRSRARSPRAREPGPAPRERDAPERAPAERRRSVPCSRGGVAFHGHVADRLPPFALDALRPAHSDVGPEPFYSYERTTIPLDQYVEGHDHVKVKVRALLR